MKKRRWSEGIHSDLDQALTENAPAKLRFETLPEEEQERLRRRAEKARDREEVRKLTNDLLGSQEGHPPYQL